MIIDWNVHMFSSDTERYPFHPRATYVPGPERRSNDPLGDYLTWMDTQGIDAAVLVHPEPYGDDHSLVLDCLHREQERLVGTALFYPDDPDAPQKLTDLVAQEPRIVSTRFHAVSDKRPYLQSFDDPGVKALWERAAALGLIVELHIRPDYAEQAAKRIAEYPDTPVLIDHLAEPHRGNAVEYADVLDLSRFDNVYMKLSGLGHFAGDEPTYPSARAFTRRVIDAFTPQRMVWGSGTPDIVDTHMAEYSQAERDAVKGDNLAKLLKFDKVR